MKKYLILGVSLLIAISIAAAAAADKDEAAVDFVKTLISKATLENGSINALRFFQYTATPEKGNPSSYILSKWGKEIIEESGLKVTDKGKFIPVLSKRSGARIEKLWKENKEELLKLFPVEAYESILQSEVDSLLEFRDAPEFAGMLKKMKVKSRKPGVKSMDAAGAVTGWSGYKQLSFWYRRDYEKNDKVVYAILKELKAHYGQKVPPLSPEEQK